MLRWSRNTQAEKLLDRLNVKYEYREINLVDLKIEESKKNNARFGQTIDEDTVESYAVAMGNNAEFPAIVCTSSGFVLDGNHRVDAAGLNDATTIMAYVVLNADKQTQDYIIRTCNVAHGLPITKEHRLVHAAQLVIADGVTISAAAKAMNLKYDAVRDAVDVMRMRQQLETLGVPSATLHKTTMLRLHQFKEQPDVLKELGGLAVSEKLTIAELDVLIVQIMEHRSQQARLNKITTWRSSIVGRRDRGAPFPERSKFFRHVTGLHEFLSAGADGEPFASLEEMGIRTDSDRKQLQRMWKEVRKTCDALFQEARQVSAASKRKAAK